MEKIVGIDAKIENKKIVLTFTTKGSHIDFLKYAISEKDLEYVNLYNIPIKELVKLKKKINEIISREIKVEEILEKE